MTDLSKLRGHESWKWYGYPGHRIVARRCAYHLCTRVENYLVSTVGAFYPRHDSESMERVGGGKEDFFETFVFMCMGETNGDPDIDFGEIDGRRYADSRSAECGHYEMCWKYHRNAPRKCSDCLTNYADPPSTLCPGCQAYRDHTGAI